MSLIDVNPAGIIAVIQFTGSTISLCYQYIEGVKNAPQDIRTIIKELRCLQAVLERLEELASADVEVVDVRESSSPGRTTQTVYEGTRRPAEEVEATGRVERKEESTGLADEGRRCEENVACAGGHQGDIESCIGG
jgi:hypothetical protein